MNKKTLAASMILTVAVAVAITAVVVYAQASSYDYEIPFMPSNGVGLGANNVPCPCTIRHKLKLLKEFRGVIGPRIEVSDEYREVVIDILQQDGDVFKLLEEGYNVTNIRPIIKAYVGADGTVTLRATQALVTMVKKGTGLAVALVDLESGKVAKLVLHTKTVIEK